MPSNTEILSSDEESIHEYDSHQEEVVDTPQPARKKDKTNI